MRKAVSRLTIVLLAVACIACGGDPEPAEVPELEEVPEFKAVATNASIPEHMDREKYILTNIVALAEGQFPDDTGLEWTIHTFDHRETLTLAEVEPNPSVVGYPRFQFAIDFTDPAAPSVVATYAWIDEAWALLSSSQGFNTSLDI